MQAIYFMQHFDCPKIGERLNYVHVRLCEELMKLSEWHIHSNYVKIEARSIMYTQSELPATAKKMYVLIIGEIDDNVQVCVFVLLFSYYYHCQYNLHFTTI